MKLDPERLKKVLNTDSEEYVRIIRQIWEEGRERAIASVTGARQIDREKSKTQMALIS